ncbi:MAG TPA: hypothetical protein VMF50_12060 [Candidatus Binataceae bacterium]|nr:hypothetical protein [Candidatus Binataceae bacterium]
MRYGAKCDGRTDDAIAIRRAIKIASSRCVIAPSQDAINQNYIVLPAGRTCVVKSGIVFPGSCAGLKGNGAVLDFRSLKAPSSWPSAITIVSSHPYSPYGDNLVPWNQLHLIGPGASSATIGLRIETGHVVLERPDINGFGVGIQLGNYAYVDQIDHPSIWNTGAGIDCPAGLKDAGENITVNQGAIFNSGIGVRSFGCGISMNQTSFDGLGSSAVITRSAFRCFGCYIEYFAAISAPIFDISNCNAWSFVDFRGGTIQNDHRGANIGALVSNHPERICGGSGPWASFDDVFFANLNPQGKCDFGAGAACIIGSNSHQVRILNSTNGSGGGSMGNVHLP